jgi:hypothetical protein
MMKSSVFWQVTPYSPLKVTRRFRGICRPRNFITTAVRTSNPAQSEDDQIISKEYCASLTFYSPVYSDGIVIYCDMTLKAEIVESEETSIAEQRLGKQVSAATDTHATTEELLATVEQCFLFGPFGMVIKNNSVWRRVRIPPP